MNEARRIDRFWGDVAPCEHLVQFYEDEGIFMDTLEKFVIDGLWRGESVLAIATGSHLASLRSRIRSAGLNVDELEACHRYMPLDAAATLSEFMLGGWPDETLFEQVIQKATAVARHEGRPLRAFGEMVALLWGQGHHGATLRLEHLWCRLCARDGMAVFCAYPRIGSTRDLQESVSEVCALHTQVRGVAASSS